MSVEALEARDVPSSVVIARAPDVGIQRRLVADFNGDGKADTASLLLSGKWTVSVSNGTRLEEPELWADWAGSAPLVRLFAADFNGDGKADVAALTRQNRWFVGLSDGDSFASSTFADFPPIVPTSLKIGDFNGDGKADVAGLTLAGAWQVGLSTGTAFTVREWATGQTGLWKRLLVGDFNGDGKDDIAGLKAGSWQVAQSTGASFQVTSWANWDAPLIAWQVLVGDFNGDGKDDVAAVDREHTLMLGQSTGSSFTTIDAGDVWKSANQYLVGDFNGDGQDEIAARRGNRVHIEFLNNSVIVEDRRVGWNPSPAWPYGWAADFDGDGREDLASRASSGAWLVTPVLDGKVPVAKVWFYPYSGDVVPYVSGAPWNPSFPKKFVQVTSDWILRQMNHNNKTTFTQFVYSYMGVLRGWASEAGVLGITERTELQAFLRVKLNEKFAEVRPQLEAEYPGLTENKYRLLMTMNLAHAHFRYAKGYRVPSLFHLLSASDGNCAHYARTIQELSLIQGISARHIALLENFGTPYGPFSTGHNLVIAEGMILDGETNLAFDIGTDGNFSATAPQARLPKLLYDGKVYGFYNWLTYPPIRAEQLARGEDGGTIAYYYWFYLWGLDQGATRIFTVPPMTK